MINGRLYSKHRRLMAILLVTICSSATALCQDTVRTHYADRGFYLGLAIPYMGVGGNDFDGTKVAVIDNSEILPAPDIDPGPGGRILLGVRMGGAWTSMDWGFEFNVQWSKHDGAFGLLKPDVDVITSGLNARVFFLVGERIQPSVHAGFLYAAAIAADYGVNAYGAADDILFFGYGGEFGGNLNIYLTPRVSLVLGGNIRPMVIGSGKGTGDELEELDEDGFVFGWDISLGLTFTIPVSSFND